MATECRPPAKPTPSNAIIAFKEAPPLVAQAWGYMHAGALNIPSTMSILRSLNYCFPDETVRKKYGSLEAFSNRLSELLHEGTTEYPKAVVTAYIRILAENSNVRSADAIAAYATGWFGAKLVIDRLIAGN